MCLNDHRPRRSRPRPNLRFRHNSLRRRAMGPPLDNHRHIRVSLALARARIMGARYPYYLLADSKDGQKKEAEVTRTAPSSAPTYNNIRQGLFMSAFRTLPLSQLPTMPRSTLFGTSSSKNSNPFVKNSIVFSRKNGKNGKFPRNGR